MEKAHLLRFTLENGEIHEMPEGDDPSTYRKTTFKTYIMSIDDIDRTLKRSERQYRGDREMSAKQMGERISGLEDDIRLVESKMVQSANSQIKNVFDLLDPVKQNGVLNRSRRNSSRLSASATESKASRHQIRVRGAPADFKIPERGRAEYITYRALTSQQGIKQSYYKQINRYRVEIHKKFSIPFACIVFVLLGAPLAIRTGRSGMNTAIGLSILFFLVYYVCLIGGEKLADRRFISPFAAMWGANILCGTAGILLARQTTREQSTINWNKINILRRFYGNKNDSHSR